MEASARARFVRISPTKARMVIDMVRGKSVENALNILVVSPKRAARIVTKLLESAVAEYKGINTKINYEALIQNPL